MSHPLFFPGVTYFYPIGNTSAVRLTEHLPPEKQANILLLACGDPRHILYTVYTNETSSTSIGALQTLDVTCCDMEAAVLARNALLFTLLADKGAQDRLDLIWNIFYHFMLDQESLSLLTEQCRKLATLAEDLESWNAGPYSRFLSTCDKRTLAELHRFWSLYAATADYTPDRRKRLKESFLEGMKEVTDKFAGGAAITSSRSAGPLLPFAVKAVAEQFRKFWSTGVTDDGLHSMKQAASVNPTFAFSMSGEKFTVHYGVDPVAGFHLAEAFVSSRDVTLAIPAQKLVQEARRQFSQWCISAIELLKVTSKMSPKLVIRMFAGDALRLCQAFSHLNSSGVTATPILSSPWKASRIEFEENQYGQGATAPAPTTFNVIDTSNVSDHVGLLNLLVVTAPLLSKSPFATLYTEALVSYSDEPAKALLDRLFGDVATMSLLLGMVPSAFLSRFTSRSNVHETFLQVFESSGLQYHEQVAWKAVDSEYTTSVAPDQLHRVLFKIYLNMFAEENMARQLQSMSLPAAHRRAFLEATLVHYTRRSFVQLLHLIKSRVQTDWTMVMQKFDDEIVQDTSLILGSSFYQEMCCHFHLLDIISFTSMEPSYIQHLQTQTKTTIFKHWDSIPPVVTIVLVIPRERIAAVESELRLAGTPLLQCEIRNAKMWNIFTHIFAVFGRLETTGTGQTKTATIVEERESTSSPLIVFFAVPSSSLLLSHDATVGFRTRPSPHTFRSPSLLEAIFTAPLEDSRQVHILAQPPFPSANRSSVENLCPQIASETKQAIIVQMDATCTEIRSLVLRMFITDPTGRALLAAGSTVKIEQIPSHGACLFIGEYSEKIFFPLPIDTTNAKLRVARKSMYIEVVAPLAVSAHIRSEDRIAKRFFTKLDGGVPTTWNVHRVNLDRCTPFRPSKGGGSLKWLSPHISLMFSHRERAVREMTAPAIKDTLMNLKDSIHSLLLSAAGTQDSPRFVFALQNTSAMELLAVIIVAELRLDAGSHTVLADAWVVPGTAIIQNKMRDLNVPDVVVIKLDPEESEAWRYLLPLLVERCRTWSHRPSCEYLTQGMVPLSPCAGADPEKSPFCSCGVGFGTETLPPKFKSLSAYATRVAISPLFAVPYLEKVGMTPDGPTDQERCKACGKQGGSLSLCGKCKKVRYCSKECQVKDWKVHKKACSST